MDYTSLIKTLTPDIVERLRKGVETGRWPDGRPVSAEQREHSLQAIIAWETQHLSQEERVGYIDTSKKNRGASAAASPGEKTREQNLRWVDDTKSGANGAKKESGGSSQ